MAPFRASVRILATPVLAGTVAASLLLVGCAAPGRSVTQTVRVETPGCDTARCELSNDQGHWSLPSTPGMVTLTTSHAPLQVSCQAAPGKTGRTGAPSTVAPPGAAGAVAGGVAGGAAVGAAVGATALSFIPPLGVIVVLSGVAVGAATGHSVAADRQSIRYPELIQVGMDCRPPSPVDTAPGPRVGLDIRSLSPEDARAAGLGEHRGVRVDRVVAGGPAAAAGLQAGDILVEADGTALTDTADLSERLQSLAPGASLRLRVWRSGQWLERELTKPKGTP